MTKNAPTAVLSDSLTQAIRGRRIKTAVFLTFQFDPSFFEEEILPVLFEQTFSHIPQIRLIQLEERLRNLEHIVVYYDRRGLLSGDRPAHLDYRRIGLYRKTGFFHPKNILFLVENQSGKFLGDSLLFVTLSGNLTESGWWRNVEVAYMTEVRSGDRCTFRDDLRKLLMQLKKEDRSKEEHPALDAIDLFLRKEVEQSSWYRKQGRLLPHLYYGQSALPDFLQQFIDPDTYNLDVISPYFDDAGNSQTLAQLLKCVRPKATRVFLPISSDASAECLEEYFQHISMLPQVSWGVLPDALTQVRQDTKMGISERYVHAKVYRFWNQSREILFLGSVNLTSAAHTALHAGNFESGILVETEVVGQQGWWLQPIENIPTSFRDTLFEDSDIAEPPCPITFRFDWETQTLSYFWEAAISVTPQRVEVLSQNVFQFEITPVQADRWIRLGADVSRVMKNLLVSTSLLDVHAGMELSFRVLVQEDGMAHKPALFLSLTPEEILHYWSLLSPEQREQFIVQKSLIDIDGYVRQSNSIFRTEDSMFDRFAGIFHAFGSLETYVYIALETGRETEAVYRLLGEKHDSLSSLLDKIVKDNEADRVHRYVTLLCAQQLLDHIERDFPDFKAQHRQSFKRVRDQLRELDQIEAGFSFDTPESRTEFFGWFREMFLKPAKLPKVETE